MKILQNVLNKIKRYNLQQLIIGGLQMNTYKIPDSITKKVQSIQTKEKQKDILDEIYSKLDNVSNKFSGSNLNSVPDKIELEKKEFTRPSDEQIKLESEQALSDYKNNEIENINNEYRQKQDSLINNKESLVNTTNEAKEQYLHVKKETLEHYGAVSVQTADEMIKGLLEVTGSDYALATTGIAGPTGGTEEKPVGLVYIGVGTKDEMHVHKYNVNPKLPRIIIKYLFARQAIKLLIDVLKEKEN